MNLRIVLTLSVAALLAAPAATAWSMYGAWEPDTPQDRDSGRMFLAPDVSSNENIRQVYFNAWQEQYPAPNREDNVNFQALGSRVLSPNMMSYDAALGIWKDCNNDGYLGIADTAQLTYNSALLLDGDIICPEGGMYNVDGTVTEWISIGAASTAGFRDNAQVWGDFGLPDGFVHFDCPHEPLPYGATGSTGGVLMWADCFTAFTATQTINALDPTPGKSLSFDDAFHPERECDSLLQHDIPVWGNPQREEWCQDGHNTGVIEKDDPNQAGHTFDCNNAEYAPVRDPTAEEGQTGQFGSVVIADPTGGELSGPQGAPGTLTVTVFNDETKERRTNLTFDDGYFVHYRVATPNPSVDNPTGSQFRGLNETEAAVLGCSGAPTILMDGIVGERGFDLVESHFAATNPDDGKRAIDFPMSFASGFYSGAYIYLSPTYNGGTVRNDLQPEGAIYFTFYAALGANSTSQLQLPPAASTPAVYGSEVCGTVPSGGKVGHWDCNVGNWYNTALGGSAWSTSWGANPVVPGVSYHMRDIDCYDGTVAAGLPVYASLAYLSDSKCA